MTVNRYDDADLFPRLDDRTVQSNRRLHSAQALADAMRERPERARAAFGELVEDLDNADATGGRCTPA
jgi:hypothetical protein